MCVSVRVQPISQNASTKQADLSKLHIHTMFPNLDIKIHIHTKMIYLNICFIHIEKKTRSLLLHTFARILFIQLKLPCQLIKHKDIKNVPPS